MSQRVRGAMLSYLLVAVKLFVTLLYTPVLVSALGTEGYGLFALVGAMAAYLYLLDFGLNDSVLRFFVAHENETETRNAFLARMLGFYTLLGALVLATTWGLLLIVEPVFGGTLLPDQLTRLGQMILVTGAGAAVLVAFNPLTALLFASERFVFLRGLEIVATIISVLIIVVLLRFGYREVMVASVMALSMILQVLLRLLYARVRLGVRIAYARPDAAELRRVMGYAAPILVSMVAELVFFRLDHILIGAILGAAPVAVYAIGVTFNKYFMSLATSISRILTPDIIRNIDNEADPEQLTDMMIRISRVQALVLFLVLGGLIVLGQQFLILWLGPEFVGAYWVMLAILCAYVLEMTGNARNIIMQVKGLYWRKSAITAVMALINIPLTLWFLDLWGITGAAAATGLGVLAGYGLIAVVLQRSVGLSMWRYWRETARGILPVFLVLVACALWLRNWLPGGWSGFCLGVVVFTVAYGIGMLAFAANDYEKGLMRRMLSRVLPDRGAAA